MWEILSLRNSWTHDRGSFDPIQSVKMAKEALAVIAVPGKLTKIFPGHGWRPPEDDVIKINIDGGLSMEARKGDAGGVARSRSAYLGAWSKPLLGIYDPLIAETLALREGVIVAKLRGFQLVVMETDCIYGVSRSLELSSRFTFSHDTNSTRDRRASFKFLFFCYSTCVKIS
jgi:hypothetical protein